MTTEEAILHLRASPEHRQRMIDSYLGDDLPAAAAAFARSEEFAETCRRLGEGGGVVGKTVIDLGAGTGISTHAFLAAGAAHVIAVDPDPSDVVGLGALARLCAGLPYQPVEAFGEKLPLPDACADAAYCRQVLHHTQDLPAVMRELYRCLRPGGTLLCAREHVVSDDAELAAFLRDHPVHQLAGGENAYRLGQYQSAITAAGFERLESLSATRSVISAYPMHTAKEVAEIPLHMLRRKVGPLAPLLAKIPLIDDYLRRRVERTAGPGRLYTFSARKPK